MPPEPLATITGIGAGGQAGVVSVVAPPVVTDAASLTGPFQQNESFGINPGTATNYDSVAWVVQLSDTNVGNGSNVASITTGNSETDATFEMPAGAVGRYVRIVTTWAKASAANTVSTSAWSAAITGLDSPIVTNAASLTGPFQRNESFGINPGTATNYDSVAWVVQLSDTNVGEGSNIVVAFSGTTDNDSIVVMPEGSEGKFPRIVTTWSKVGSPDTISTSPWGTAVAVANLTAPLSSDYRAAVAVPALNETAGNLGHLIGPSAAELTGIFGGNSVVEGAIAVKVRLRPGLMGTDGNKTSTYILGTGTPASNTRSWNLVWLGGAASAASAGRFQFNYQRAVGESLPSIIARRIAPNEQGVVEAFLVFRRKANAGGTWEALAIEPGDSAVVAPTGDQVAVNPVLGIASATPELRLFNSSAAAASPFNYAGGCEVSNFIYIQGAAGTDAEWLRVANGESPATVFPSNLHYWYRLGGLNDLAKTAGSRTGRDFAVAGTGVYTSTPLLPTPGSVTAANSIYVRGSNWGNVHPLPPSALIENEAEAGGLAGLMAKTGTVVLPVTIGGTATRIEVRVCREDDGAILHDWALCDVEGGTGANLTGNNIIVLSNVRPSDGVGHIYDVRRVDNPSSIFRYRAREDVGLGVAWGPSQSQMARALTNDAGAAGTGLVSPVAGVGDTISVTLERAGTNWFVPPASTPLRNGMTTNGFMAFANMWRTNFPKLRIQITALAKSGTSTQQWLEDKVNAVTPLNWWGDGVNRDSGVVTAHVLAASRRFSAFLVSWHTDDRGKVAGWEERFNELFTLNEASTSAAITSWTVDYASRKSFAKFSGGLVFAPHVIGFPVSRESETTGSAMTASRSRTFAAQRSQQFGYFSLGTGRAAGITSYVANYQTATQMPAAAEAHQTNAAARGNPLFSVQVAQGLARAAGLTPNWYIGANHELPKVSGATGAGTSTITVSFSLPVNWTLRTLDAAATAVEEFWLSQDNGVNWVRANTLGTVTIVSGQVRLAKTTGNWADTNNMLIQYNASAPVSSGNLTIDNTRLGQMLFAEMPATETVRALWPGATSELVDGLPIAPDIDPVRVAV